MSDETKPVENTHCGKNICPICHIAVVDSLGEHLRSTHGEGEFRRAVLEAKEGGMPDPQIGSRFGISFKQVEKLTPETYGITASVLKEPKRECDIAHQRALERKQREVGIY